MRHGKISPLLEPRVERNADAGELGDLFAAQARRAPACARGKTNAFDAQVFTAAAQQIR